MRRDDTYILTTLITLFAGALCTIVLDGSTIILASAMTRLTTAALTLSLLTLSTTAQTPPPTSSTSSTSSTGPPAAVFTYSPPAHQHGPGTDTNDAQFVFALNIDQEKSDLYLHMSAPDGNDWMAVGIGSQMKDSLIFVAYPADKGGKNITLSPRIARGHSEPSYTKEVECSLVTTTTGNSNLTNGIDGNGNMVVNAVCHNATKWSTGSLDTNSPAQDFIFAVGPGTPGGAALHSTDLSAGLRRHEAYGTFRLDLTKATASQSSSAGIPQPNDSNNTWKLSNAMDGQAKADNDPAPAIHGFIMCVAFVIIFPLGTLVLRVMHRVIGHAIVQGVALFLVCCATAGGCVVSTQYNRSRNFASAHQVIGILLLLALISQLGLGILHHRIFKKTQAPTVLGKIHLYLGPGIMLFGIINAPIGFVFAGNPHLCLPYFIILLLVIIVYITIRFGARICCRGRRKLQQQRNGVGAMPAGGNGGGAEGYQYPQFGPGPGQGQGEPYMQAPPPYGRQTSYGASSEDVPLRPYESQASGVGAPPAYPRTMV